MSGFGFYAAIRALRNLRHKHERRNERTQTGETSKALPLHDGIPEDWIPVPSDYTPKEGETVIEFRLLGSEKPSVFLMPHKDEKHLNPDTLYHDIWRSDKTDTDRPA